MSEKRSAAKLISRSSPQSHAKPGNFAEHSGPSRKSFTPAHPELVEGSLIKTIDQEFSFSLQYIATIIISYWSTHASTFSFSYFKQDFRS